jgi:hypothetical protein
MTAESLAALVVAERDIQGPQLLPIKVLHRHDGYISFADKIEEDDFRPKFAIRADALDSYFPS